MFAIYANKETPNNMASVIEKFSFFKLIIPTNAMYNDAKPEIECVTPENTLSIDNTGYAA